jgi:hypothetical protein
MFWASLTFSLTEALFIYPFFVGLCAARHRQKGKANYGECKTESAGHAA